MKDKTCVTVMVCFAEYGHILPLSAVGKSKQQRCFILTTDRKPPLSYTSQNNVWSDIYITYWWIINVFWPHHLKYQGNVNAILTLDNCTGHNTKQFWLTNRLGIKFLTPKVTSLHQSADMVIIAYLKVGYKALYLRKLLGIFDTPGGYKRATVARKWQRRGCRVAEYCGKPRLLDFMMMLQQVLNGDDGKYVLDDSDFRCRRKVYILPVTWNSDINNNDVNATLAHSKKVISDDVCNELWNLMVQVKVKSHPSTDTSIVPAVFQSSFVVDPKCSPKNMDDMVSTWVNIEYYREIVDAIVDE